MLFPGFCLALVSRPEEEEEEEKKQAFLLLLLFRPRMRLDFAVLKCKEGLVEPHCV